MKTTQDADAPGEGAPGVGGRPADRATARAPQFDEDVTGWRSAKPRSQVGRLAVETKALLAKVSGKSQMKPADCAASTTVDEQPDGRRDPGEGEADEQHASRTRRAQSRRMP